MYVCKGILLGMVGFVLADKFLVWTDGFGIIKKTMEVR